MRMHLKPGAALKAKADLDRADFEFGTPRTRFNRRAARFARTARSLRAAGAFPQAADAQAKADAAKAARDALAF
jgi:hypothetical protein